MNVASVVLMYHNIIVVSSSLMDHNMNVDHVDNMNTVSASFMDYNSVVLMI